MNGWSPYTCSFACTIAYWHQSEIFPFFQQLLVTSPFEHRAKPPSSWGPVLLAVHHNPTTFGPPLFSVSLSQWHIDINTSLSPFSADPHQLSFRRLCPARLLGSYPSTFTWEIHARSVLFVCFLCSHNNALTSIPTSLPFMKTPISSPFDPSVLLGIFSVTCPSGLES